MEPIVLNENGAKLCFKKLMQFGREPNLNENTKLGTCLCAIGCVVGTHMGCWVHLVHESETHRALWCRDCGLRIVIPAEVNTYGKLRQWCAQRNIGARAVKAFREAKR